ncbi:hypothetical protein HDU97_009075 [Phlyctochytrium planicorne]|nr:hypothetical protein HDU97_009075 [Phlyctochytrium planicorne]
MAPHNTHASMYPPIVNSSSTTSVGRRRRLRNFAVFYGWPSCCNSAELGWDLTKVSTFFQQYDYVVFGGDVPGSSVGLASSSHGDHANTITIIQNIKVGNPQTKVYGYITIGSGSEGRGSKFTIDELQTQINAWCAMGASGIFVDEAGFDYWNPKDRTEMRRRQIAVADISHNLGLSVTFNAWNPVDLTVALPASFSTNHAVNTTITNPDPNNLTIRWQQGDAILYESYIFSSAMEDPKASHAVESYDAYRKHVKDLQTAKSEHGVEIWGCQSTSLDSTQFDQRQWEVMVAAALLDSIDAVAWTTSQYSATGPDNARLPFRDIPPWAKANDGEDTSISISDSLLRHLEETLQKRI